MVDLEALFLLVVSSKELALAKVDILPFKVLIF
jgi:hypothetical protein